MESVPCKYTKESAGRIAGEFRGATEIVVVPPFEPARVTLELNGNRIATFSTAPYRLEADLGSDPVQQTIRVTVSSPGRKGVSWDAVINSGKSPLSTGQPHNTILERQHKHWVGNWMTQNY